MTWSTALLTGAASRRTICRTRAAMPPTPRIAASTPSRTGIERASARSIRAGTPPLPPRAMAMTASSTACTNAKIWRACVTTNRTKSMISFTARTNADAGLSSEITQVIPATTMVGVT
ncbi:hypothetical protein [Streptomyces thermolilacinus]|uniref:hypothetical protein n=1 Tax=Streptomyces thermolilacinus TaxID=285540 RepID=UPI0033E8B8C3